MRGISEGALISARQMSIASAKQDAGWSHEETMTSSCDYAPIKWKDSGPSVVTMDRHALRLSLCWWWRRKMRPVQLALNSIRLDRLACGSYRCAGLAPITALETCHCHRQRRRACLGDQLHETSGTADV